MDISYEQIHAYLDNPTERQREELRAIAKKELLDALSLIVNNINKLKAKGLEEALFYNPGRELERVYRTKEITKTELESNPLKAAYEKYVLPITYGVVNLAYPAVFLAILADIPPLTYEKAETLAIKNAEKYIEKIQKETGCTIDQTAYIMKDFIRYIQTLVYDAYHKKEYIALAQSIRTWQEETARIEAFIKEPVTDKENDVYYKQIEELENEYHKQSEEYQRNTDKREQARAILAGILKRLYPGEIVKVDIPIIEKIEPAPEGYYLLAQSHASNNLTKKLTEKITDPAQYDIYGNGSIIEGDFKLFIRGYRDLISGVKQSAAMLLDSLIIKATKNGLQDTLITLPVQEYLEMRDLKDEKEIKKQIINDIDTLERIKFNYKGIGKNKGVWLEVSIYGGTKGQIKNGDILFRFNQDFFNSFKVGEGSQYLFMYFPKEGLKGNTRANPWKYYLARKIAEHKRMNIGKPNQDIICVKTLINACPNYPTYEEVNSTDRAIGRRIIEPFERDLDALNPSIKWEYQDKKESPKSYQEFIDANIIIHWSKYPETKKLEAAKKKRAKKKQPNNKKKEQKTGGSGQQNGG